jgi:hypothetical protein
MEIFVSTWAASAGAAEERLDRALRLLRDALGEAPP